MDLMNEGKNRFKTFISRLGISETNIADSFQTTEIQKVEIDSENKSWTLFLKNLVYIPKSHIDQLKKDIEAKLNGIAKLRFVLSFPKEDSSLFLDEYWLDIIHPFAHTPSIYNFLKQAEKKLDNNTISIYADNNQVLEILQRKRMDNKLTEYINFWYDENFEVDFICEVDENSAKKFNEELEQEVVQHALSAVSEVTKNGASEENEKPFNGVFFGKHINEDGIPIKATTEETSVIVIEGKVFGFDIRELKSNRVSHIVIFNLTDYMDSIQVKVFVRNAKKDLPSLKEIKNGLWVRAKGEIRFDDYSKELVLIATDLVQIKREERKDIADEKRVELHAHTNMSAMDGITPVKKLVEQAANWGHKAIAITDHGGVQAFPDAFEAGEKHGIKVIYGLEANVVDDGVPIVHYPQNRNLLDDTYVVFDTETTGLSAVYNSIIEIGAVKMKDGEIIDRFETFVTPEDEISEKITEITGITNEMVKGAPSLTDAISSFMDFIKGSVLVAHNARFDKGFLNMGLKKVGKGRLENPIIDTVELARFLYPKMKNFKLNTLCKALEIELLNHHRALDDAEATGHLTWKMILELEKRKIVDLDEVNRHVGKGDYKKLRPFHVTVLVKNEIGLKNLYKIVSKAHIDYFFRNPRIPKSILAEHREGLMLGTACDNGQLFDAMLNRTPEETEDIAGFYDYLEIQPISNYRHLIKKGILQNENDIKDIHSRIIQLANKLNKPVIATGDVHHIEQRDEIFRKILVYNQISGFRYHQPSDINSLYFRTTDEMLDEFSHLGETIANQIVVENPNKLIENVEKLKPFPDDLFTPVIEGAEEEVREMSYDNARRIYGNNLPEIVEQRLEKELDSIIGHGFSVIYLISHKLVNKSLEDGYLVGSRGSVGSSFVATMTNITEVNPLPPHYVCPNCKHNEFILDGSVGSGFDLPDKECPSCNTTMEKNGHDIPFETFMGFKGDKVPDIDLNFSGEYQPRVHKYTEELFGSEYVYRAGTISTVAEKTAYGYVKKYVEEQNLEIRNAEISRLAEGCSGVKRTTGQHPGGLMVIPQYKDVFDFTPIQRPADDMKTDTTTTHFDYHAISGRLLKLDILGHDDPTAIRMLQDLTGIDPKTIPVDDPNVYEIFRSTDPLHVKPEQINTNLGALGIPEFGTKFVRQMLEDTKPKTFAELVRISGLSHGTDVWLNNAQDLIRGQKAVLAEVISTRDDIMVYLIQMGLDSSLAFQIMEKVRKGKGLKPEDIDEMKKHHVPQWYIDSCQKIKYMFPKAHAVAYVLMAIRIAYFKVYYPIYYYVTYFSVRADEFDLKVMKSGSQAIKSKIEEINQKGVSMSPKEKGLLTVLELALEMVERGFKFKNVDLYRSDANKFLVDDDKTSLIPPLSAIPGIGVNAARNLVEARNNGEFLSIEDLQSRAKISKSVIELLNEHNCLKDMPETNQLSLF